MAEPRLRLRTLPWCETRKPCVRPCGMQAAYLGRGGRRELSDFTPELSRRARGIELWAGLRQLGRAGMAAIVERTLRSCAALCGGIESRRVRGAERCRSESGAGFVRRCRENSGSHRTLAGGRNCAGLVRRSGRKIRHAHQRLELGYDGKRRRGESESDDRSRPGVKGRVRAVS